MEDSRCLRIASVLLQPLRELRELLILNGRRIGRQVSDPLLRDRVCPAHLDKAVYCGMHNDIPVMKGYRMQASKTATEGSM